MRNWSAPVSFQELLKETRQEWSNRVVELLYSIFCLDMQQITLTLLGTILPNLLTDSAHWQSLVDPPGKALAKYDTLVGSTSAPADGNSPWLHFLWSLHRLCVWCALSSYSSHHKGPFSARQRKRQREDIEVKENRKFILNWLLVVKM